MTIAELLISSATSWPTPLLIIAAFGFFPGIALRVIVLGYSKDDPRRKELVAELYALPYWERPIWVAQQLETVLFDGIPPRIRWVLTGRVILRWRLGSGVRMNRKYPDTFEIPTDIEKSRIRPGDKVKLMFEQSDGWSERMWVQITKVGRFRLTGELINQPFDFPRLCPGRRIKFWPKHIIAIADSTLIDPHTVEVAVLSREDVASRNPMLPSAPQPPELPPADAA